MIEEYNKLRYLAMITGCQARIAAMQAANQHRISLGESIAYREDHFYSEAADLETMAEEILKLHAEMLNSRR